MQTFLPFADYAQSARVLDYKRLGKQRVESLQILKALTTPNYGWKTHPATKMWRDHPHALAEYSLAICDEWIRRGYRDTCREKIIAQVQGVPYDSTKPEWLGDEAIHSSHRSNLLRKDPVFYGQFGWLDDPEAPYVWPVN